MLYTAYQREVPGGERSRVWREVPGGENLGRHPDFAYFAVRFLHRVGGAGVKTRAVFLMPIRRCFSDM